MAKMKGFAVVIKVSDKLFGVNQKGNYLSRSDLIR